MEEAYNRGLRHFGLLHDSDASEPPGDVYTNPPRYGGLAAFGAAVIKDCNRLGILIDLAHANVQTTEAAIKLSTRTVIISHTGLDAQLATEHSAPSELRAIPKLAHFDETPAIRGTDTGQASIRPEVRNADYAST